MLFSLAMLPQMIDFLEASDFATSKFLVPLQDVSWFHKMLQSHSLSYSHELHCLEATCQILHNSISEAEKQQTFSISAKKYANLT